jgi:hypothetical protein
MKVLGSNGKYYTRDHPKEIISPHVMRFEEIRYWLRELSTNPAYGWVPKGKNGLERALGMGKNTIRKKLTIMWIWPKEQVRLTARIRDILDGRVVPRRFSGSRVDGVYVDPPQPPVVNRARTVSIAVEVGPLRMLPKDHKRPMKLPEFRDAFKNVVTWDAK